MLGRLPGTEVSSSNSDRLLLSLSAQLRMSRLTRAIVTVLIAGIPCSAMGGGTTNGSAVCVAGNTQYTPKIVSDGAGGAIVAWLDRRVDVYDIYAQRILPSGTTDPAWPVDGRALCTAINEQLELAITSDGIGGAIVAWTDYRGGSTDIYAQHVLASGQVDPAWPLNGASVCSAANYQFTPQLTPDGAGGAIVTWADNRSGNSDTYAQHVLASGAVDPAWPSNGRALCVDGSDQTSPVLVSDGAGGAIIAWLDPRSGSGDIYAQRVLASGGLDPAWPVNGRAICAASGQQDTPTILANQAGAIVAWRDRRNGIDADIYAQSVLATGNVDPSWPANGRALCACPGEQGSPVIASDNADGAIVVWEDARSGMWVIYAQRVLGSGLVDSAWPSEGRSLATATNQQTTPVVVADGTGGAIVAWSDFRSNPTYDIYAQHVLSGGSIDPTWPPDGRALSAARGNQTIPTITANVSGGAIVAWADYRNGTVDIYSQGVDGEGILLFPDAEVPFLSTVADIPNDQGGKVKVSWRASSLDIAPPFLVSTYWIWRSVPPRLIGADGTRLVRDPRLVLGAVEPTILVTSSTESDEYWEFVAERLVGHLPNYSFVASTTSDSIAESNPYTTFMIQAWSAGRTEWWFSNVDSGYSVDNLAPQGPSSLTAEYRVSANLLRWSSSMEPDLLGFRLYRGDELTFVPGPGNLVYAGRDTMRIEEASPNAVYKLSAVDIHGNESRFALATPTGSTTSVAFTADAHAEPSSVTLRWYVMAPPGTALQIYRRTESSSWSAIATAVSDAAGMVRYQDKDVRAGQRLAYRLGMMDGDTEVFGDETWVTVPNARLAIIGIAPNPAVVDRGLRVRLSLPRNAPTSIQVLDISGRIVASQNMRTAGAGVHEIKVEWERRPPPGVYWIRLTQGQETVAAKVGMLR